jgi:hypothetical protein
MAEGNKHDECGGDNLHYDGFGRDGIYEYENSHDSENDELNETSQSSRRTDTNLFWWFFISHKSNLLSGSSNQFA